ncbi:trypsin-like serine peptidase [Microbulbifer agarilyticus]
MKNVPHFEREELLISEIHDALVTGTLPVFFSENPEDYIWGKGSLFLCQWGDYQFAITAKHVIENQNADYKKLRILFPGYKVALPVLRATTPNYPNHECREEVEDIFVWQVDNDPDLDGEELEWHAWRMNQFWMPASKLEMGQQLFAVGYPFIDERYDYENNKINVPPLVSIGKLSSDSIGKDIYTIDCDEFEVDLNGISGGPVFARFDGLFHYVGLIIRAGKKARKIHFVDATYVTFVLNEATNQL